MLVALTSAQTAAVLKIAAIESRCNPVTLHVQDVVQINFPMAISSASETAESVLQIFR